jgi:hypothetical protein
VSEVTTTVCSAYADGVDTVGCKIIGKWETELAPKPSWNSYLSHVSFIHVLACWSYKGLEGNTDTVSRDSRVQLRDHMLAQSLPTQVMAERFLDVPLNISGQTVR